ncbi:MAG TPA: hypothetical protein VFQ37_07775, partial [Mycobacterium sp.]|nr:hypothetical protein [Mycobacterium sp.]
MKPVVIQGVLLVVGVELLMLLEHQRQLLLWAAGTAVVLLLLGIRRLLGASAAEPVPEHTPDGPGELLRRWMSGTETRIHWSESTRMDWDRHWRPILARRFEIATGQRRAKDSVAFDATGRMLFGGELWEWVDPSN